MDDIYISRYESKSLSNMNERVISILSKESELDEFIKITANKLLSNAHDFMEIQFGYKVLSLSSIEINSDKIIINENLAFNCNRIIASQLKGIEGLLIFAATLGRRYDKWFRDFFNSNHPLEGYIADMIGSVAVECAADILEENINARFADQNLGCSNRYSPGYCNWDVAEQKKLFSFLPDNFCDIELTESSLMIPIKSVSGIIGFGKNVVKKEYACKICTQENCYLNKLKVV